MLHYRRYDVKFSTWINGLFCPVGDVVELTEPQARRYVSSGMIALSPPRQEQLCKILPVVAEKKEVEKKEEEEDSHPRKNKKQRRARNKRGGE